MGAMFEAQCICGYASETLLEGCGMAGPDSCRDLARCGKSTMMLTEVGVWD
jgi:hypothetical protein